jgi:hypothetical protein
MREITFTSIRRATSVAEPASAAGGSGDPSRNRP